MPTRRHRLLLLACATSWFLVGLHVPALHEMTDHGGPLDATVVAIVALLAVTAIVTLWRLLHAPARADGGGR